MEQKLEKAKQKGLQPSKTLDINPVRFYSNAPAPLYVLSNFYETPCDIEGEVYPSAEHAYQCLQKSEGSRVDWQVGGRYSDWDFVYDTLNKERETDNKKPLSTASWQTKKRQIGILAVLVIRRPELFGLTLVDICGMDAPSRVRYDALSVSYEERWYPIFEAKYENESARDILMKTAPHPLVEIKRSAHMKMLKSFNQNNNNVTQRAELWGANNYDKEVWGRNITGENLTRYRDSKKHLIN